MVLPTAIGHRVMTTAGQKKPTHNVGDCSLTTCSSSSTCQSDRLQQRLVFVLKVPLKLLCRIIVGFDHGERDEARYLDRQRLVITVVTVWPLQRHSLQMQRTPIVVRSELKRRRAVALSVCVWRCNKAGISNIRSAMAFRVTYDSSGEFSNS